jgi:nucleotide-binding universal stress UspA family protein
MKPIQRILVASDFSGPANTAYVYAQETAKLFNGTVDALHIVPTLRYFQESLRPMVLPLDMEKNFYPKVKEQALGKLAEELSTQIQDPYRGKAFVQIERKIAQAIADFAKDKKYDLLVIGNIGSHDSQTHRGGIAERLVRKSRVPVFAVPNDRKVHRINNILVPLDFTTLSMRSIPFAVYLAKTLKSEITFMNVVELYESRASVDLNANEEENTFNNLVEMANKELPGILEKEDVNIAIRLGSVVMKGEIHLNANNETYIIPLNGVVRKGINAYSEIMDYAEESADAIVMTTHGSEGLAHFLLGSTTEKIVYNTDLPIITIRPEKIS